MSIAIIINGSNIRKIYDCPEYIAIIQKNSTVIYASAGNIKTQNYVYDYPMEIYAFDQSWRLFDKSFWSLSYCNSSRSEYVNVEKNKHIVRGIFECFDSVLCWKYMVRGGKIVFRSNYGNIDYNEVMNNDIGKILRSEHKNGTHRLSKYDCEKKSWNIYSWYACESGHYIIICPEPYLTGYEIIGDCFVKISKMNLYREFMCDLKIICDI